MNRRSIPIALALLVAGCVFATDLAEAPDGPGANNGATNNGGTNNGAADGGADAGRGDGGMSEDAGAVELGEASIEERSCGDRNPLVALKLLTTDVSDDYHPRASTRVAVGGAPDRPAFQDKAAFSVAWVHAGTDTFYVGASTVVWAPSGGESIPTPDVQSIGTTSQTLSTTSGVPRVFDVEVFPKGAGGGDGMYDVHVMTSDGYFICSFTTPDEGATVEGSCSSNDTANNLAKPAGVFPMRSLQYSLITPIVFGEAANFRPLIPDVVFAATGGEEGRLSALQFRLGQGLFSELKIEDIGTPPADFFYAEQLIFGVDNVENGYPYLVTLRPRTNNDGREAVILAANEDTLTYRESQGVAPWPIPPQAKARAGKFGFTSSLKIAWQPASDRRFRPAESSVRFGFVSLGEDDKSLIVSRPGGIKLGEIYPHLQTEAFSEDELDRVLTEQNILPEDQFGDPVVVTIGKGPAPSLRIGRWDFESTVTISDDLLAQAPVSNIRDVATAWFFDNFGTVAFVAENSGAVGLGFVLVPSVADLLTLCPVPN